MRIRPLLTYDVEHVVQIERSVWCRQAATRTQILDRAAVCPEGSIVAELPDHTIVGYAAAQRVSHISTASWGQQTGDGTLINTHEPQGAIAYGVNMSVLPQAARHGVSGKIIAHYAHVFVAKGGCSILCLGARLPGYRRWRAQHAGSVRDYLALKRNGYSIDPELRLYERAGFHLLWELPGYFPDQASDDFGAMVGMNGWEAKRLVTGIDDAATQQ